MAIRSLTAVPGIFNGQKTSFPRKILGKLDVFKPNDKVNPYLTLRTKINLKWIKDL